MIQNQQQLAKWQSQHKRMSYTQKVLDFYNNMYQSYILDSLKILFPNNYNIVKSYLRKFPITNTLTDDISILFRQQPTIQYYGNGQQIVNNYINNSNLWKLLPTINRLVNLTYKIGILPRIYNDKIIYQILTPDKCWVQSVQQFPSQISALYYITDTTNVKYSMPINIATKITAQTIQKVQIDSSGNTKTISSQINPYGYIPIVWIQIEPSYQTFWPTKRNPLIQLNEYYVIAKTYQAFALAYQAIATMITKGLDPKSVIPFGPTTWINLPSNGISETDAKYITPGTDFQSMFTYSEDILTQATAYVGISAQSYKKTSQYASGYALQLAKVNVNNYNTMQIPTYTKALAQLINMTIDTINIYTSYNINTTNAQYRIKIELPQTMLSYAQKLDNWKKQLQLGIISMQQILRDKNPDWSQQQLVQYLATIAPQTITQT